ncbi:MAG: hypothetical protein IT462_04925 [Planctomycetes bacterium]|nr:hypothetical protein [Planctomycetota bacterium]
MAAKCECPPPAPPWLTTWGDLCSLLLTFFVLLITMANFNPVKMAAIISEIQGAGTSGTLEDATTGEFLVQITKASAIRADTVGGARPVLAGEALRVQSHKDNYVVRFAEQDFFERFRVTLTPEGKRRIDALARKLKDSINVIHVIGRLSGDESEEQFQKVLQTVQLRDGTGVRVLSVPFESFKAAAGGTATAEQQTVLIQSRSELAAKRAETVASMLVALGINPARIRQVVAEPSRPLAEDAFAKQDGSSGFVFAYGGPEAGRTVEIVVTGEVINSQ